VNDDNELIRVQLARMEGKQDVTNERLETANRINDERHTATQTRFSAIDGRLNTHGDRISGLESREVGRDGERRGLTMAGRVVWAAVGLVPGGAIAAVIMKAFGS
jgi:hypothetical protein